MKAGNRERAEGCRAVTNLLARMRATTVAAVLVEEGATLAVCDQSAGDLPAVKDC